MNGRLPGFSRLLKERATCESEVRSLKEEVEKRLRLIGMFAVVAMTMLVPRHMSAADDVRLIDAAKSRNIEAVSAALKTHADVNARQRDGATALHWAAHFDDVAMAQLLIRAGARAGLADDTGVTP